MPDRTTWQFINTFAPWLAAVATTFSALVALYLGLRSTRIKLRVDCDLWVLQIVGGEQHRLVDLQATNIGVRDVTLEGIIWTAGLVRKRRYRQVPPSGFEKLLPAKLLQGEKTKVTFSLLELRFQTNPIFETVRGSRFPKLAVRQLRAGFFTTTGTVCVARLRRGLRDEVVKQVRAGVRAPDHPRDPRRPRTPRALISDLARSALRLVRRPQ